MSADSPQGQLPPVIELAWGRRPVPAKGPRRGLTLEQIVAAAVTIALTEGLAALSMSKVAAQLGASTMSLYRYVTAKDELLVPMIDSANGPPPKAYLSADGWRAGLARWAVAYRDVYRRHPWAIKVPITAPPLTPNTVGWMDDALRCLSATSLSEQQKLSSVLLLSGFVRNEATLTADLRAAARGEAVMPGYSAMIGELIAGSDLPGLAAAIASGALDDDDDLDGEFDFGLTRILDGLEGLIKAANRPSRRAR